VGWVDKIRCGYTSAIMKPDALCNGFPSIHPLLPTVPVQTTCKNNAQNSLSINAEGSKEMLKEFVRPT
jgi:hypothetical protein